MDINNTRISKLRDYMFTILDELLSRQKYQLNADFLDSSINNYSLDKIPTQPLKEKWITGARICKDIYNFRCRNAYGADVMDNLSNIGFFEMFEQKIEENNNNEILPEIEGIRSIECLNCGALSVANTDTAEFTVQIQITYYKEV